MQVNYVNDNVKSYPSSITKLSNMLIKAQKDSLPECPENMDEEGEEEEESTSNNLLETPPQQIGSSRAVFKKSHTCGSLFAKCSCNNENHIKSTLLQATNKPYDQTKIKRSSTPAVFVDVDNNNRIYDKRFSNPDLSLNNDKKYNNRKSSGGENTKTVIKQVYLNHPEINFPITVEIQNDSQKNCDIIVPNRNNSNVLSSNLDYHKYTALAYESNGKTIKNNKDEQANKFLKDFGIFGPMGNGASTVKKTSNDSEVLERIRKSSKIMCIDAKKTYYNVPEDYEYLKSLAPRLEKELSELECKLGTIETELTNAKKELSFKENKILRLQREIHKLKVSKLCQMFTFYLV